MKKFLLSVVSIIFNFLNKVKTIEVDTIPSIDEFSEHYEMALFYAVDKNRENFYCFSLTRFPDSEDIEIMVHDQINCRVSDLDALLYRDRLEVIIDKKLAKRLDHYSKYIIRFNASDPEFVELENVLKVIFKGKSGLKILS